MSQRHCENCGCRVVTNDIALCSCVKFHGLWYCVHHSSGPHPKVGGTYYFEGNHIDREPCVEAVSSASVEMERPKHYANSGKIRDYVVADDWKLPAMLAQCLKYLYRYRSKGKPVDDLRKAQDCIGFAIEQLQQEDKANE